MNFDKKSVHRNKMIADLFHRMGEVEKAGSGINRIRDLLATSGLSDPRFEFTSFFTIILDRKPQVTTELADRGVLLRRAYEGVNEGVGEGVKEGVKLRLSKELVKIYVRKAITRRDIEQLFNVSTATAERDIAMLKEADLITFEGAPKTGKYALTKKGNKMM
jgi:ATP-dependent DNA helicase RecG